jgi:hypothetical protein
MLGGPLCLLCGDDVEDVLQLSIHHVHPISGGCGKSVKEHSYHDHILASPGVGRALPPLIVDGSGNVPSPIVSEVDCYGLLCLEHGLAVVQFGQLGFHGRSFTDKFIPTLRGPALGVSLLNTLLVLLIGPLGW